MANENLLKALSDLALDLRWSWNHAADKLWSQLDPELWGLTRNAWLVLQTLPGPKLDAALADDAFRRTLDEVLEDRRRRSEITRWFQTTYPASNLTTVAYFSMEFMLSDALPL
ncbi:MAG TPA: DUF3417 domain-containing protein, partial [Bryobacteraceae bacterium]